MSQKRDGLYLEEEQSFLALGTFSKLKKLAKPHHLLAFVLLLYQQSALGPLALSTEDFLCVLTLLGHVSTRPPVAHK